jgi:excisionase family DNA binding protein
VSDRGDPFSYPPRGLGLEEAARYLGIGRTKFTELVDRGSLPRAKKIDGRKVWDRIALDLAFADLPEDGGNKIDQALHGSGRAA